MVKVRSCTVCGKIYYVKYIEYCVNVASEVYAKQQWSWSTAGEQRSDEWQSVDSVVERAEDELHYTDRRLFNRRVFWFSTLMFKMRA